MCVCVAGAFRLEFTRVGKASDSKSTPSLPTHSLFANSPGKHSTCCSCCDQCEGERLDADGVAARRRQHSAITRAQRDGLTRTNNFSLPITRCSNHDMLYACPHAHGKGLEHGKAAHWVSMWEASTETIMMENNHTAWDWTPSFIMLLGRHISQRQSRWEAMAATTSAWIPGAASPRWATRNSREG